MFELWERNLPAWIAQVFIIAAVGAIIPALFRIRHPRTQLVYCHLLLAACLVLPFVQPWKPGPAISADGRLIVYRQSSP
jgi:hypothetical protein